MNRLNLILIRKKILIIFIILAIFAGLIIFWYLNEYRERSRNNANSMEIYVASRDIPEGYPVSENMIEAKKIKPEIYSEKFLTEKNDIVGRKAVALISKGQIINSDILEGKNSQEKNYLSFSSYIPNGLRAISIPVNYYGDNTLVDKGDKVDIISTYYDSKEDKLISQTVLVYKEIIHIAGRNNADIEDTGTSNTGSIDNSNISILGSMFSSDAQNNMSTNPVILTFYLRPEEVEIIINALQSGTLNLAICPK